MTNPVLMRSLALSLAVLLSSPVLYGTVPAHAAPITPGTSRYRVESVAAQWLVPTRVSGEYEWVVVRATRRTDLQTNEVRLFGSAGIGECVIERNGALRCGADLRSRRVVKFEADAPLRTVSVVLRNGMQRERLTWTADQAYALVPPVIVSPEPCENGDGAVVIAYVMTQRAQAAGKIFGRHVSTADEPDEHRQPEDMTQTIETKQCP